MRTTKRKAWPRYTPGLDRLSSARQSVVVARRWPENDPLKLGHRRPTKAHGGLKALSPQLTRVERAAQFVEGSGVLLRDVVLRRLDENQVAGATEPVCKANVGLAFGGVERRGRQDDGVAFLQALGDRRVEQL